MGFARAQPILRVPSTQTLVGGAVAVIAAALVLYPIYFLFQAALNVGDPEAKPPTDYGFDNFVNLGQYGEILLNTVTAAAAMRETVWSGEAACACSSART